MALSGWTLAAGPWNSVPMRSLDSARGRKLVWRLDGPAELSCTIDGRSDDVSALALLSTDIWAYRDGVLMFRGRIVNAPETIDADHHSVALTAVDYRGLLLRRYVQSALDYVGYNQTAIAWGLVEHTQNQPGGNLGITFGVDSAPATARERHYAIGENLGERLAELGRVDSGFEWWIDHERILNFAAQRGQLRNTMLDYGGTVAALAREPDVSGFANQVLVTGSSSTTPTARAASDVGTDARGRWERVSSFANIAEQANVNAKADALLAEGQLPPVVYSVQLVPGVWPVLVPLDVGDRVPLWLQSGQRDETLTVRVDELSVTIGDEGEVEVAASCTAYTALSRAGQEVPV